MRRLKILLGSLLAGVLLSVAVGVVLPSSTSANALWPPTPGGTDLVPDPTGSIPGGNLQSLSDDCAITNPRQSPGFTKWVSIAGAPTSTTVPVPYGTASIDLDYHYAGAVCWGNSAVTDAFSYVSTSSASPAGTVSGINGTAIRLTFSPYNQIGRFAQGSQRFTYAPAGGFTTSGWYRVTLTTHDANIFTSGVVGCSSGGGNIPSIFNIASCGANLPGFDIYVTVGPNNKLPLGNIDVLSCGGDLQGWAFDPDSPNTSIQIHVYFDYPAGGYPGGGLNPRSFSAVANVSRPDVNDAFGIGGNHGFNIDLDRFWDAYTHNIYVYAIDTSGGNTELLMNGARRTWGPCAPPTCNNNLTLNPSAPQPGQSFNARAGFNYNPGAMGWEINWDMTLTMPGATPGSSRRVGWSNTTGSYPPWITPPGGATNQADFGNFTYPNPGTPSASWTVLNTANGPTLNCGQPGGYTVGTQPYLKAFGNDVKAGSAFVSSTNTCALSSVYNQKASILTLGRNQVVGSNTQWMGAGSQLAAFALGEIDGFSSAITRSPNAAGAAPPKGLTFGNYYDAASTYGGRGGQYGCIPDYYTIVSTAVGGSAASTQIATNAAGFPTNLFLRPLGGFPAVLFDDGPTTIPVGSQAAVVVDGDMYVAHNVSYQQPYSSGNVPSLYVIVRGDIYIGSGVTNLSGVYIAQPKANGTGGNIYTCSKDTGPFGLNPASQTAGDLSSACNQQLTINGAFIARDVKFLRSGGTLSSSAQNETWTSTNIAEVFKSSAELYLSAPSVLKRNSGGGNTTNSRTYDSITSLPPVL